MEGKKKSKKIDRTTRGRGLNLLLHSTQLNKINMKKLTKEEKKEKQDLLINILGCSSIILTITSCVIYLLESNKELASRNERLEKKNSNLEGRIKSLKDENKRLVRENYEACYHLGKKSISHPKTRIRIRIKK